MKSMQIIRFEFCCVSSPSVKWGSMTDATAQTRVAVESKENVMCLCIVLCVVTISPAGTHHRRDSTRTHCRRIKGDMRQPRENSGKHQSQSAIKRYKGTPAGAHTHTRSCSIIATVPVVRDHTAESFYAAACVGSGPWIRSRPLQKTPSWGRAQHTKRCCHGAGSRAIHCGSNAAPAEKSELSRWDRRTHTQVVRVQ